MVFIVSAIIFIVFTIIYAAFSAAIIYHLKQYTIPGHKTAPLVITIFLFLSGLFWLFGIYFLMGLA